MGYGNRNSRGGSWGAKSAGNQARGEGGTITVLMGNDRFVTVSAFTDRDGARVATVTCAKAGTRPAVLDAIADTVLFGAQDLRQTLPVAEAIELAKRWIAGQTVDGGGL